MSEIYYRDQAQQHAPKTQSEVEAAAVELSRQGFSATTIAAVLRMDTNAIRAMLGPATNAEASQ